MNYFLISLMNGYPSKVAMPGKRRSVFVLVSESPEQYKMHWMVLILSVERVGRKRGLEISDMDEQPQAFCNYCGGQLEILEVTKDNPFPYKCSGCGQVPSSVDGPPHVRNLAKTYVVNLNHIRSKEK